MAEQNQSVGGLTEAQIERIRQLKGYIQSERSGETITNANAVMWAVNNELERRND